MRFFVTGELGGSLAGRHLEFEPRLAEARWLVEHFKLHALMDVSDGLAGDLRHILNASQVGAELMARAVAGQPRRDDCRRARNRRQAPAARRSHRWRRLRVAVHRRLARRGAVARRVEEEISRGEARLYCRIMAGHGLRLRDKEGSGN